MNEKIKFARVLFLSVGEKGANKDTYYTCKVLQSLRICIKGILFIHPSEKLKITTPFP